MNESLVYNTINLSIIIQIITGVISVPGLYKKVEPEHEILKSALWLEMFVQIVQLGFYVFFIRKLMLKNMASTRYFDWFITTPLMLFTSVVYYKYEEYIENFERDKEKLKNLTLVGFLNDYKSEITKIVILNFLMLLFGYLGEIGVISDFAGFSLGFLFFILAFSEVYKFAKKSKNGIVLYKILFVLWSIYGVVYLFNPVIKNTAFNGLDIIAKNFFGVYLFSKILQTKKL